MLSAADVPISEVLRYFTQRSIEVAFLVPTGTGIDKSIMDATASVRDFLKNSGIHDFDLQPQGKEHKRFVRTRVVTCSGIIETKTSLYRPDSKKGDPRIWVYRLGEFAEPGNVLALVALGREELLVINASNAGLVPGVPANSKEGLYVRDAPCVDLEEILAPYFRRESANALELLGLIRAIAGTWHNGRPGVKRDLEVGRLLEELLGISANSSKAPDYKGIELKASRIRSGTRQSLFAKVPDWSISPFKSSAQILDAFGYERSARYLKQLRCTVSSRSANPQGLFLVVESGSGHLLEASNIESIPKVAYWPMSGLRDALLAKHPETFWVSAAAERIGDVERFRYDHVLHTRKPIASALPTLLESGKITVDHMIKRDLRGRVTEQGPMFKINRRDFDLLFPPGELHVLKRN